MFFYATLLIICLNNASLGLRTLQSEVLGCPYLFLKSLEWVGNLSNSENAANRIRMLAMTEDAVFANQNSSQAFQMKTEISDHL